MNEALADKTLKVLLEAYGHVPPKLIEKICKIFETYTWVKYNWENVLTHPPRYGKYFICRKDGKVCQEIWNGVSWAHNGPEVTCWLEVKDPYPSGHLEERGSKITRVEVRDQKGRSYVNWKPENQVELSLQDENRTLKIFIKDKL